MTTLEIANGPAYTLYPLLEHVVKNRAALLLQLTLTRGKNFSSCNNSLVLQI